MKRSQPQSEQPIVFLNHVPVRHPSDVIADRPVQSDLFDSFARLRADFLRVLQIIPEQLFHHTNGPLVRFVNDRIVVEVLVEVLPELEIEFAPL